jgi:hypothetical protein
MLQVRENNTAIGDVDMEVTGNRGACAGIMICGKVTGLGKEEFATLRP